MFDRLNSIPTKFLEVNKLMRKNNINLHNFCFIPVILLFTHHHVIHKSSTIAPKNIKNGNSRFIQKFLQKISSGKFKKAPYTKNSYKTSSMEKEKEKRNFNTRVERYKTAIGHTEIKIPSSILLEAEVQEQASVWDHVAKMAIMLQSHGSNGLESTTHSASRNRLYKKDTPVKAFKLVKSKHITFTKAGCCFQNLACSCRMFLGSRFNSLLTKTNNFWRDSSSVRRTGVSMYSAALMKTSMTLLHHQGNINENHSETKHK